MKSVLKSDSFKEKTIVIKHPKDFKNDYLHEQTIVNNSSLVDGKTQAILLDGVKINIREGIIKPPFILDIEHDFPFLKIHFEMEGSSKYTPKNDKSIAVTIPNGHYNFFFFPEVKGTLRYDTTSRKSLEILFTKNYLNRIFGKHFKDFSSDFGTALKKNIPFLMWKQSKPITTQLHLIIKEICNCNYKGGIKKAYLEAKITEILTLFLNNLKDKENSIEKKLPNEDYSKILHAETVLIKNLKNPPTISELSILTGINQFKLKQHFKLVFNKPIFKYLTGIRMEEAKRLINKGYTISETAYEIGYKNPQHFTTAFKKTYNYLPSNLKTR